MPFPYFFKYMYSFCRYIVYLFMHFCNLYHFWIFLEHLWNGCRSVHTLWQLTLTNDNSNFINIKNAPRIPGCILIKGHFELTCFFIPISRQNRTYKHNSPRFFCINIGRRKQNVILSVSPQGRQARIAHLSRLLASSFTFDSQ